MAHANITPVLYPALDPWDYLRLAVRNGVTQKNAQELSGISHSTWMSWLYHPTKKNGCKNQSHLEKLHRIAADMGWIEDNGVIAA